MTDLNVKPDAQAVSTAESIFDWAELERSSKSPDYYRLNFFYRIAANLGHAPSQNNLGTMFLRGLGVKKNFVEAADLYRKAALQGEPAAQFNLAKCYQRGEGVPRDLVKAFEWFELAAGQGDIDAMYELGTAHRFGQGVPVDLAVSEQWYQAAGKQRNTSRPTYIPFRHPNL